MNKTNGFGDMLLAYRLEDRYFSSSIRIDHSGFPIYKTRLLRTPETAMCFLLNFKDSYSPEIVLASLISDSYIFTLARDHEFAKCCWSSNAEIAYHNHNKIITKENSRFMLLDIITGVPEELESFDLNQHIPLLFFGKYAVSAQRESSKVSIRSLTSRNEVFDYQVEGQKATMLSQLYMAVYSKKQVNVLSLLTGVARDLNVDIARSDIEKCLAVDNHRLACLLGFLQGTFQIFDYTSGVLLCCYKFENSYMHSSYRRLSGWVIDCNYLVGNYHPDYLHTQTIDRVNSNITRHTTKHGIYNLRDSHEPFAEYEVFVFMRSDEQSRNIYSNLLANNFVDVNIVRSRKRCKKQNGNNTKKLKINL
jgi:hypothetical protein